MFLWSYSGGCFGISLRSRRYCRFTLETKPNVGAASEEFITNQDAWLNAAGGGFRMTNRLKNKSNRVRQSDAIFGVMALVMITLPLLPLVKVKENLSLLKPKCRRSHLIAELCSTCFFLHCFLFIFVCFFFFFLPFLYFFHPSVLFRAVRTREDRFPF